MDTSLSATADRIGHLMPSKREIVWVSCWLVCPLSKKDIYIYIYISDHCSLQIRQSSLYSDLCLVPVVAMAVNPPDPVEQWIFSACATWPKPQDTPDIQATLLYAGLTLAGVMQLRDFEGLNSAEAMAIWPHLKETPTRFVDHLFSCLPRALLAQARRCDETLPNAIRQVQRRVEESGLPQQHSPWLA